MRTYLRGLDGLRAVAVSTVVIGHAEHFKSFSAGRQLIDAIYAIELAGYAVDLFFVLSGFLISYLLLKERVQKGKVNIRRFYIRRAFRILPLYFLILLVAFVLPFFIPLLNPVPYSEAGLAIYSPAVWGWYIVLLPQVALALKYYIENLNMLWSVGVEEQFYLFWPRLVKGTKLFICSCIFLIIVFPLVRLYADTLQNLSLWHTLLYKTKFDLMAFGGLFALLYKSGSPSIIKHRLMGYCILLVIILLWTYYDLIPAFIGVSIHGIVYSLLILHIVSTNHKLPLLENSIVKHIGKISYGMYIFHQTVTIAICNLLALYDILPAANLGRSILFSLVIYVGTVVIASASYRWFERYFLRQKQRFG